MMRSCVITPCVKLCTVFFITFAPLIGMYIYTHRWYFEYINNGDHQEQQGWAEVVLLGVLLHEESKVSG